MDGRDPPRRTNIAVPTACRDSRSLVLGCNVPTGRGQLAQGKSGFGTMRAMTICRHAALAALILTPSLALAQISDEELQQRIDKEKMDRRDCKLRVCDAALNKRAAGENITCKIVRTWRAKEIEATLKERISWPFGHAQCTADIDLPRKPLAQMFAGGEFEAEIPKHKIDCTLDRKNGKGTYVISFTIRPMITFKDGKAIKARMNWADIQGSPVAKGAAWSAAKLDNYLGIFERLIVNAINDFFGPHCDEVKGDLKKK
jgi:hypothetical protein